MNSKSTKNKFKKLKELLSTFDRVVVAYSGGIDSYLLVYLANELLGENSLAVIVDSPFLNPKELDSAKKLLNQIGARYEIIKIDFLNIPEIAGNSESRCYCCKKTMFEKMIEEFNANNCFHFLEGSNIDDLKEIRPGMKAIKELDILSPYIQCGITKNEIRNYAKQNKIICWNKRSDSCLASRISNNSPITYSKLKKIALGENFLSELGFSQFRVRDHENIARIELIKSDFEKIIADHTRKEIVRKFREIGFNFVTIDLVEYGKGK